jgi:hypothetical protein
MCSPKNIADFIFYLQPLATLTVCSCHYCQLTNILYEYITFFKILSGITSFCVLDFSRCPSKYMERQKL